MRLRRRLVPLVVAALVAVAGGSTASPSGSDDTFTFNDLTYTGSNAFEFPTMASDAAGSLMAMARGPLVWVAADGRSWTTGNDTVDPIDCGSIGGGLSSGAIRWDPNRRSRTLIVGASCTAEGADYTVYRSIDDGRHWNTARHGLPTVALADVDAGWLTAAPGRTVYVVSHLFADPASVCCSTIVVARSTDDGATFSPPVVVNRAPSELAADCSPTPSRTSDCVSADIVDQGPNLYTPVLVDPTDPARVYVLWWSIDAADTAGGSGTTQPWEHASKAYVARSDDAGASWRFHQILDIGDSPITDPKDENDLANWLPAGTIDPAGHLFFAVARRGPDSTQTHIVLLSSATHGDRWLKPIRIDTGNLGATFAPSLAATGRDAVDLAFYGSTVNDEVDPGATWNVYLAHVAAAPRRRPT